jgi:hypothetical protein
MGKLGDYDLFLGWVGPKVGPGQVFLVSLRS